MPSEDSNPITDAMEGITKGAISIGIDKIKSLANQFLDHKLVFINNKETIELVKEQCKSGEWSLYEKYIQDKQLRMLAQMGLTLRKLEPKPELLQNLRDKISKKYLTQGLHIAQAIQNNILTGFIGNLVSKVNSEAEIIEKVDTLLKNVDKYIIFIRFNDDVDRKIQEIQIKLQANNPYALILYGIKSAVKTCIQIKDRLIESLTEYTVETNEGQYRVTVFIFRQPDLFIE